MQVFNMNNDYEMCPVRPEPDKCPKTAKCDINVSVPVDIRPGARVGRVEMECCGDPAVICEEKKQNCIQLVVMQKVSVKIPVTYSFAYDIGKTEAECCNGCAQG